MAIFKCKMCGGTLEILPGAGVAECQYCGSMQTLPKVEDDRLTSFYERANDLRMSHEFDKAAEIYEKIIEENPEDADAYWSMVLCRYGIEYVEETKGGIRKPTINRAQLVSVTEDVNYRSALKYADIEQKQVYEKEAARIDRILQRYLEISRNEPPYDVFICYKETGADGRRTVDAIKADEIYRELDREGFKVFYAPVTLESKLGEDYEPHIFAAIHSAKVMLVIGTKAEHMNAVWVKNEWSRFLTLAKEDSKKTLIPVYGGMDPYDMPEAFRFKQSQNMDKLGFMLDLVRGIEKLVGKNAPSTAANPVASEQKAAAPAASVEPLLQRVTMFLEDHDWGSANIYCEKVLDIMPTNGQAYLYKLMVEARVTNENALLNSETSLEKMKAYKNAVRYADEATAAKLIDWNQKVNARLEKEEQERRERERIRQEREQREAEERRERSRIAAERGKQRQALVHARDNTSELLSNQVRDKENLQNRLFICENRLENLSQYKRKVCIPALIILVNTIILHSILVENENGGAFLLFLIVQAVCMFIMAKARDKSRIGAIALTVFTVGYAPFVSALKGLGEAAKASPKELNTERESLLAGMQQLENEINTSRGSLSELNSKLEALDAEEN